MLEKYLTPENVQIKLEAKDWEEALYKACDPLLKRGSIEPVYVEKMIQTLKETGPYFVISKHIALAHTRPENGAKKMDVTFAVFDPGIEFGAGEMDPIRLIIGLSATDPDSHIDLMDELAEKMMDEEAFRQIFTADTPEEFCKLMRR